MTRDRRSDDPVSILAAKMDWQEQHCHETHRKTDAEIRELRNMLHGEHGDNGLKSIMARQEVITKQLIHTVERLKTKMDTFDKRLWVIGTTIAAVAAAIGGGSGQAINAIINHLSR